MPSSQFRRRGLVTLVAVALVATGGLAYAAIPDAGGVVRSCYTKSSGAWRVIDTEVGQACKSNEAALDLYSRSGADVAFLTKTGKAADSDRLDGQDSSAFLGSSAKAADSDKLDGQDSSAFLGAGAKAADSDALDGKDSTQFLGVRDTAADSSRLGGFVAGRYVLGGGVRFVDAGVLPNGATSSFSCCEQLDVTPPLTVELSCQTSGDTTLVASSPGAFRWWWASTFGHAAPVGSQYEAEFEIANGVSRNTLRTTTGGNTVTFDLDMFIGTTCDFGWTWTQAYHINPN